MEVTEIERAKQIKSEVRVLGHQLIDGKTNSVEISGALSGHAVYFTFYTTTVILLAKCHFCEQDISDAPKADLPELISVQRLISLTESIRYTTN